MVATNPATGTLGEKTGSVSADYMSGAPLVRIKRQQPARPRSLPADAVERARADIDEIGAAWVPSVGIDVEEMLRGA